MYYSTTDVLLRTTASSTYTLDHQELHTCGLVSWWLVLMLAVRCIGVLASSCSALALHVGTIHNVVCYVYVML